MGRMKLVNGERFPMTPEEEAVRDVEEQRVPPPAKPKPPTEVQILCRAMQDKGGPVITDADMTAAAEALKSKRPV